MEVMQKGTPVGEEMGDDGSELMGATGDRDEGDEEEALFPQLHGIFI